MGEEPRDGRSPAGSDEGLSLSAVFHLLSHPHRRWLVQSLYQSDASLPLADAAEEVVRWSTDNPNGEVPQQQIEESYLELYHRHVPKLTDEGIVTFDEDETLSLTAKGEQITEAHERFVQQLSDRS